MPSLPDVMTPDAAGLAAQQANEGSGHAPAPDADQDALFEFLLRMGDNALILGHRNSEWCGHGPVLEEDIALANMALDLIGQTSLWLGLAGEIEGKGRSADDLARLVDEAQARWGRVDVLVNSAGHGPRAPVLELTDDQWHEGMEVYFLNVVRATRAVVPLMGAQGGGAIINISSAWAFEPAATFPTSAVFRAGLASFAKLFADQHAGQNIRMNNVLPGWIDSLPATEERREMVPLGRYGTAEEIAATVAFLASEGAAYITGQNLRVDGGLMRSV